MSEAQNTKVVQDCYAAFGRGDVQTILNALGDDIVWQGVKGAGPQVPTSGERRGKAAVGNFFKQVGESVAFSRFEPRDYIAQGDKVAVLGRYTGTSSSKKKPFDSDWVMVFTFRNGKIVFYQEYCDSAAINAAF
jgi:ketosteroid isomerase-like protein